MDIMVIVANFLIITSFIVIGSLVGQLIKRMRKTPDEFNIYKLNEEKGETR